MKRIPTILLVGLGLMTAVVSQEPLRRATGANWSVPQVKRSTPSVDKILDRYVQAIGGRAALARVKTRVIKASFVLNDATQGTLIVYAKVPNKRMATVFDPDGHPINEYGFDGSVGWNQNSEGGFYAVSGQLLGSMRRDAEFYREINLKTLYPKMMVIGNEKIADHETYVIQAMPDNGAAEKMYFDVQTGLLVRRDEDVEFPQGSAELKIYFEDYKEVDGINLPFSITRFGPNGRTLTRITEVKQNVAIDDKKFNQPKQ